MEVNCAFCGRPVDTNTAGTYRKTTGWVPLREQGGGNVVRLAEAHDQWAHWSCVDQEARGISTRQEALLADE